MFSLTSADAFGLGGQRHVLRLHVGGEAGVLFGGDVGGAQLAVGAHAHRIGAENIDAGAGLFQLGDDRAQMRRIAVGHDQVAAGDGAGDQKCSRLDAVGIDAVARAMQAG